MTKLPYWIGAAVLLYGAAVLAPGVGDEGPMPDLDGAVAWLNSPPLSNKALRGKVVLVNFWTYSCINSLRELPYMKAWAAKYKAGCHRRPCAGIWFREGPGKLEECRL